VGEVSAGAGRVTVLVLSDLHYACDAERARRAADKLAVPWLFQPLDWLADRLLWGKDPAGCNRTVEHFLKEAPRADWVILNGDLTISCMFKGLSEDFACQSVRECLAGFHQAYPGRVRTVIGDHELGKHIDFPDRGGMRLASLQRAQVELGMEPFWQVDLGGYRLVGVTSSLIALAVHEAHLLPEERAIWEQLRETHLEAIRHAFASLSPSQRILLFCHHPGALPFLWHEEAIRTRLDRIERTVVGHLHSNVFFRICELLDRIPAISWLGEPIRGLTRDLREARYWAPFKPVLCPALPGIAAFKDGGFFEVILDVSTQTPATFVWHPLARHTA